MEPTAIRFSQLARAVAAAARACELAVPGFASPPRVRGATRTLRRWRAGGGLVAVLAAGRESGEVLDDLIDGVIAVNGLAADAAADARRAMRAHVTASWGTMAAA